MRVAIIGRTEMLYETALAVLKAGYEIPLIITSKETPEYKVTAEDFEKLARNIGARFIYSPTLERTQIVDEIKEVGDIDIAISINYTGIISSRIISLFKIGILNAHGGDLPRYRGNACQAWAIINGEEKIGLCIHKMIGGELDSGNIISRKYFPITHNTRIEKIYDLVKEVVPNLFIEALEELSKNPNYYLFVQSTNPEVALRCYPRIPEDGKIKWDKSNMEILRLINASSEPYSGAFCFFNNKKLIIWRAEIFDDSENYLAVEGQVSEINKIDGSVIVITGKGKLKLIQIEFEGKVGMPSEIINSLRARLT